MLSHLILLGVMVANVDAPSGVSSRSWMIELCSDGLPPDAREDAPLAVIEDDEVESPMSTLLAVFADGTIIRRRLVGTRDLLDGQSGLAYFRWRLSTTEIVTLRARLQRLDQSPECSNVAPTGTTWSHGPPAFAVHFWKDGCKESLRVVGLGSWEAEGAVQKRRRRRAPPGPYEEGRRQFDKLPLSLREPLVLLLRIRGRDERKFYSCVQSGCEGQPEIPKREEWASRQGSRIACR
jgi:hypothetical protein